MNKQWGHNKKSLIFFVGFLIGFDLTVIRVPAIASSPTTSTSIDIVENKPAERRIADICLPIIGCVEQRVRQEVGKAFKKEARKLFIEELPIRASDQKLLQAVPHNQLPGGTFQGQYLPLANFDQNFIIPPGDYIIKVHFYCAKVFTFNGRGNRYPLARLRGKAAEALSTVYARASFDGGASTNALQQLTWNTQAGLSWGELSDSDRALIQKYAPEYRSTYAKALPEKIQAIINSLSRLTNGKLPSMDRLLAELGDVGKLVNTFLRARQEILQANNAGRGVLDVQQLTPLFAPEQDANLSGGVEVTPWSQISEQVYGRFIAPQGAMRSGEIHVRILSSDASTNRKQNRKKPCLEKANGIQAGVLTAQITGTVGISEADGHQGISPSVSLEPESSKNAHNAVLKRKAQTFFNNAVKFYRDGEYQDAGRAFASAIEVMSQDPEGAAILSDILNVSPVLGDIKGVLEAVYGYDLLTDAKLSWLDRAITALPGDKQIAILWNRIKNSKIARRVGKILCPDSENGRNGRGNDGGDNNNTSNPQNGKNPPSISKIPQGLTNEQFEEISKIIRSSKAGEYGDDIVVQGSRATGTAKSNSDIDFAIRVSPDKFKQLIRERFGNPTPGSSKERTMQHAIETGKIQSGEAGLRGLRKELENQLGMDVDISIIKKDGAFDNPPFIPIR